MLLELLISSVNTELEITDVETVNIIESLVESVGIQSFTERGIKDKIDGKARECVLKKLEEYGFLEKEISYDCYETESHGVCHALNETCDFCGETIGHNIDHEIEYVFKLVNGIVDLVRNQKQQMDIKKYLIMDLKRNIDSLIKDKQDVIPFIGAGLLMPMGLPSWGGLLEDLEDNLTKDFHKENYRELVEEGDYLGALDFLIEKSPHVTNDDQLRQEVITLIEADLRPVNSVSNHNYIDLLKLNSNFYMTTNYDLCISNYISKEVEYTYPHTIEEIIDTQELFKKKNQVIHLHGHIKKRDTMIVTKQSYKILYNKPAVRTLLSTIIGARPLLFMGFSFNDEFFNNLYNDLNSILRTSHYIILANPNHKDIRKFSEKNIKVIGLNVEINQQGYIDTNDYIKAIRTLINFILT